MPRVTPISDKNQVPAEAQQVAEDVVSVFGRIRGPFSVLLHSPRLAEKMLGIVKFNRDGCIVDGRLRSHAILAAVRERESAYVWSAQVGAAQRARVSTPRRSIRYAPTVTCRICRTTSATSST